MAASTASLVAKASAGQALAGASSAASLARQTAVCPASAGLSWREGQSGAAPRMDKAELRGSFMGQAMDSSARSEKQFVRATRAAGVARATLAAPPADLEKDGA